MCVTHTDQNYQLKFQFFASGLPLKPYPIFKLGLWTEKGRATMARKRYSPKQIIGKLRETKILLAKGQTVG